MREVRGVRSAAAARMSLAKAKSDGGIGLLCHGCGLRELRLGRVLSWGCDRLALKDRQDLIPRPVCDQTAIIEQQQPIDHAEEGKPVGGDDDRHSLAANSLQSLQKL